MMGFWDGSGIGQTICKQSATRSTDITKPIPHQFFRLDARPDSKPIASKPRRQCSVIAHNKMT